MDADLGDPAAHYIKAWTVNDRQDPQLGYRLGMFFLKCKRYVDAIATCQIVLTKNPTFAKIRKDVYEKSLMLLRS